MLIGLAIVIAGLYLWLAFDAYITPVTPDFEEEEVSDDL